MNSEQFEKIVGEQIETCKGILLKKAGEYATGGDRLHNFKAASGMMGCWRPPPQLQGGFRHDGMRFDRSLGWDDGEAHHISL